MNVLLTPLVVGERLCLSPTTILRMIKTKEISAVCVREGKRKKTYRIYEGSLDKWLKSRAVTTEARSTGKPSSGPHTNNRDSFTRVLPQDGKRTEVTEKSSGELDTPSGFQGVNDGR